jgi:ATP-dependent DNA helicase PIF1
MSLFDHSSFQSKCSDIIYHLINDNRNIFLSGVGGTGKSFLIKHLSEILFFKYYKIVGVTATTGVAAININGSTLHRYTGIKLGTGTPEQIIRYMKRDAISRWKTTNILIIDEISMMGKELFEKLDAIGKIIRKNDEPFGGIKIIASGDFLQLPPVNDDFCFKSKIWKQCKFEPFILNKPYRFTDSIYSDMLLRIRKGLHTQNDIDILNSRKNIYDVNNSTDEIKPTILYSKKIDVDSMNDSELSKLTTQHHTLSSYDSAHLVKVDQKTDTTTYEIIRDFNVTQYETHLNEIIPKIVNLRVGAQVMLKINLNTDIGLVNGTRGVITEIKEFEILMKCLDGNIHNIGLNDWIYKTNETKDGLDIVIRRRQFPLILAYALTIHKIQGSTLDKALCDLGPTVFAESQAYVALSRVRSLDGLYLSSFVKSSIKVNKDALEFVDKIEKREEMRQPTIVIINKC